MPLAFDTGSFSPFWRWDRSADGGSASSGRMSIDRDAFWACICRLVFGFVLMIFAARPGGVFMWVLN